MKARRKPIELEVKQWFPPGHEKHDPQMLKTYKNGEPRKLGDLYQFSCIKGMGDDVFFIKTLEGDMKVSPGDWVITGVNGEKWAVKPDIFEKTYDIVSV